jgi:hypothetical protein
VPRAGEQAPRYRDLGGIEVAIRDGTYDPHGWESTRPAPLGGASKLNRNPEQ